MFALVDTKIKPKKLINYNNVFKMVTIENGWTIVYVGNEKIDPKDFTNNINDSIWFECSSNVEVGKFYFDTNLNEIVEIPHAEPTKEVLENWNKIKEEFNQFQNVT